MFLTLGVTALVWSVKEPKIGLSFLINNLKGIISPVTRAETSGADKAN